MIMRTQTRAAPTGICWPAEQVQVDLVADEARVRRAREQVGRVVVTEHRERDDHDTCEDRRHRHRQGDEAEGWKRLAPRSRAASSTAEVDAVKEGVEGQDHERHVAVDEPEDDRGRAAVEPVDAARRGCSVQRSASLTQPSSWSRLIQASMRIR